MGTFGISRPQQGEDGRDQSIVPLHTLDRPEYIVSSCVGVGIYISDFCTTPKGGGIGAAGAAMAAPLFSSNMGHTL